MSALLEVVEAQKSYGAHRVLKGLSISVEPGETYAVIGPNGAGKTTLFRVMTGETFCESGRIVFAGHDVTRLPAFSRARLGMGRTFQVARVFPEFTVEDNIIVALEARAGDGPKPRFWTRVRPSPSFAQEAEMQLDRVGLADKKARQAKFLSHGDKKRLELAITLAGRPRILMLDEPTAGMSPSERMGTAELIGRLREQEGLTVVMTEHDMDVVFGLAHRILVMSYGEAIASGTIAEIRANPTVQEVYLGKEMVGAAT